MNKQRRRSRSRTRQLNRLEFEKLEPRQLLATFQIIGAGVTNDETISLQIDGQTVQTWDNLGGDAYGGQFVSLNYSNTETVTADQVRISFDNDLYDPANNIDRNVRIDALILNGIRYETESPTVFSTGTWRALDGAQPGFRESEFLHTDGYFQFAEIVGPQTLVEVRASGDEGGETFDLQIDGQTVGSYTTTTGFQTFSFQTSAAVTEDQIRVVFTNDEYVPDVLDRNLNVDYVAINGAVFETEASTVFSTGTWVPSVGVQPGFRLTETLHTNGYFGFGQAPDFGEVSLGSSIVNVGESDGFVEFTVVRRNGTDGIFSVDYATVELTATAGEDYEAVSGVLTFLEGESSKTVRVSIFDDSSIESDEQFGFAIDNIVGEATLLAPRTATTTIDDNDSILADGDGLLGEYFDASGFTSRFLNRVDSRVNFDWGSSAPISGMGADTFTVRWSGQLEPRFTETYTFETRTDDGVRLWVNDELIVNQWINQAATTHSGSIDLVAGELVDIRMEYYEAAGAAVAQLFWQSASQPRQLIPQSQLYAADPPDDDPDGTVSSESIVSGLSQPTSIEFTPDGSRMYIAEKRGTVRVFENGELQDGFFLDFRDRVNGTRDRGLLDIAVHPDFESSPYVYLLYTYEDPVEVNKYPSGTLQGPDGRGNRAGRLTRVTADATTGYTTIVPDSEVVLVGKNSTWENFNAFVNSTSNFSEPPAGILANGTNIQDFIASDSESHTVGSVEFGPDGALYLSIGDGTSYNRVDPRTVRVQDIDNLSGKILRIDPISGEGLTDNPFYNGDVDANRSKVYQLGVRNSYRIAVDQTSGQVYSGDVGWTQWEEVNAGGPGANFGWPYYEGGSGTSFQTNGYQDLQEAQDFYASGAEVTPAGYALNHSATGINAIVLGDVYTGDAYPSQFQGDLFFNDLGQGIVRNISFDADGNISSVEEFATGANIVVDMENGPDGHLYFVDLDDGVVGRWLFVTASSANSGDGGAPTGPMEHNDGGEGVVVAVIDSGVDLDHPDLVDDVWENPGEIPGDGIDNDGNGYVDDVNGYDFVGGDAIPEDENGHGTFMAGVITATDSGVADGATIMPIRALDEHGNGNAAVVADAIYYAVNNGADIINLSLETVESAAVQWAVEYAADRNVLVVFSAGNDGDVVPAWSGQLSGSFETVVTAGALDIDQSHMPEANNVGDSGAVQVDANGVRAGILPDGESGVIRGTSVSAATISAAAALILAENRDLNAAQLRDILLATLKSQASGSDALGSLDIAAAIDLAVRSTEVRFTTEEDRLYVSATSGDDEIRLSPVDDMVDINGIRYFYPGEETSRLIVNGDDGINRVFMTGSDGDDNALIQTGYSRMVIDGLVTIGRNVNYISMYGLGGDDQITIYDTAADDELEISAGAIGLSFPGGFWGGFGFEDIRSVANAGGEDSVTFIGTNANDRVIANPGFGRMVVPSTGFFSQAYYYESVTADLKNGFDSAILNGSANDETLSLTASEANFSSDDFSVVIENLERTTSNASGGTDTLYISGSAGRDVVNSRPLNTLLVGSSYDHRSYGFESTTIYSNGGGLDRVSLLGSGEAETVSGDFGSLTISSDTYSTVVNGFPTVWINGSGGNDLLDFAGAATNDVAYLSPSLVNYVGGGQLLTGLGFEQISFDGGGGDDQVNFVDSALDDILILRQSETELANSTWSATGAGFELVNARSLEDDGEDTIQWETEQLDYQFAQFGDWA